MVTVTLLHPGEMGAAVGSQARAAGAQVVWVPHGRSPATHARAGDAGLLPVSSLDAALAATDVVLSICPPEYAEDVARAVAAHPWRGLYVDANAISPQRMDAVASLLASSTVVDGCIIGGPPSDTTQPRLYLSGDATPVARIAALFVDTHVDVRRLPQPIGAASALKMAFGGYQKTTRVLAALCQALAREHDVAGELTAEGLGLAGRPLGDTTALPGAAARAWRWGPEMREVADSLAGAGLPGDLLTASAAVMAAWNEAKDADLDVADVLDRLRDNTLP